VRRTRLAVGLVKQQLRPLPGGTGCAPAISEARRCHSSGSLGMIPAPCPSTGDRCADRCAATASGPAVFCREVLCRSLSRGSGRSGASFRHPSARIWSPCKGLHDVADAGFRARPRTRYLERVHDVVDVVDQTAEEAIVIALDAAGVGSRSVAPRWPTRAPLRRPRPPAVATRWPVIVPCQPSSRARAATSSSRQPRPSRLAFAQARGARSAPGQGADGPVAASWTCPPPRHPGPRHAIELGSR
jgi:hypothetical protein